MSRLYIQVDSVSEPQVREWREIQCLSIPYSIAMLCHAMQYFN